MDTTYLVLELLVLGIHVFGDELIMGNIYLKFTSIFGNLYA